MEKKNIHFRSLTADEIECRIGRINSGGVTLLLYKNARADQQILDEIVGPLNWQKHYCRDNRNCIISIYDPEKGQWIEKEDVGTESNTEKEKGLASDSFKRASTCWGIGRELYTAPNIFIPKDKLKNFYPDGGTFKCKDGFFVKEVTYDRLDDKRILTVTIAITEYGKEYGLYTFKNKPKSEAAPNITEKSSESVQLSMEKTGKPETSHTCPLSDDEIILIGNCKGKKYGSVKNDKNFLSFVGWAKKTDTSYPDPAQNDQLQRIKNLNV